MKRNKFAPQLTELEPRTLLSHAFTGWLVKSLNNIEDVSKPPHHRTQHLPHHPPHKSGTSHQANHKGAGTAHPPVPHKTHKSQSPLMHGKHRHKAASPPPPKAGTITVSQFVWVGEGDETTMVPVWYGGTEHIVLANNGLGTVGPPGQQPHETAFGISPDGGNSFRYPEEHLNGAVGDWGDPSLAVDTKSNIVYLAALPGQNPVTNQLMVAYSLDGGSSFSTPVNAALGFPPSYAVDKPDITVDNWSGAGQGNVYAVYKAQENGPVNNALPNGIYFSRSVNGVTWQSPVAAVPNDLTQGAQVVVGSDHSIYIFYYAIDANSGIANESMVVSHDGGAHFSAPQVIELLNGKGDDGDVGVLGEPRTNSFPQVVVNPVNSDIVLAWNDVSNVPGEGTSGILTVMDYKTQTWTTKQQFTVPGTADIQWDIAPAFSPDGRLGISWYRQDAQSQLISRWATVGLVNGTSVSFFQPVELSTAPFSLSDAPEQPPFLGDYDATVGDGKGFVTTYVQFTSGGYEYVVLDRFNLNWP